MIIGRTGDGEKYCQLDLYKQIGQFCKNVQTKSSVQI